MQDVVIIGGGIAGLAAAHRLQKSVEEEKALSCTLIEAQNRLGGVVLTEQVDGFVIEAGPDSFISYKPGALELCRELDIEDRLIGAQSGKVYVLADGELRKYPAGLRLGVPTAFAPILKTNLLSWPAKLRLGLEPLISRRSDDGDVSIAAFFRRRLGEEASQRLVEPLLGGIHAGDAGDLSLQATFPRFLDLEAKYGSLVRAMLAQKRTANERKSKRTGTDHRSTFLTLENGLEEIVGAVVPRLDRISLVTGVPAVGLRRDGKGSYQVQLEDGTILQARAVILATPAYATAKLVGDFDIDLAKDMRRIPYSSTATVSLAFTRTGFSHPLDGTGFVVPSSEERRITACSWTSSKFPHRAPDDQVLLRCFVGKAGDESLVHLDDGSLVQVVQDELRDIMGVTAEPVLTKIYRWEKAMPQYRVGHPERVEAIEGHLAKHPGLFVTGGGYRGVGLPDCIRDGQRTAEMALKHLQTVPVARIRD